MNRKLISKAFSRIDDVYISETLSPPAAKADRAPERTANMNRYEKKSNRLRSRRLFSLIAAACLLFAFALTAYAFNIFGIREMLQKTGDELPEEAYTYIQTHDAAADSTVWKAEVTESLCDENNIYITIRVTTSGEYILAPTDASPEHHNVSVIGLEGDQNLGEYVAQQNKKLLCVGAGISERESLGITACSESFVNVSPQELNILLHAQKTTSAPIQEVTCSVTGVEDGEILIREHLPIQLVEAPSDGSAVYVPASPDAIPGLHIGDATVTETPLGYSIRYMETITDEAAFQNIKKVEFEGLDYGEGGSVLEDDGNWYLTVSRCTGTVGDTLTVHFYDWDNQLIGSIEFVKK